jgi:hypothetical protein
LSPDRRSPASAFGHGTTVAAEAASGQNMEMFDEVSMIGLVVCRDGR